MILDKFKHHYRTARAEITGEAKSKARLVRAARDIPGMLTPRKRGSKFKPAQPIAGAYVRMFDKKPMQFFTDGSLRHVLPAVKPGKALRKALKRQRQRQRAESLRRANLSTAA